MLTQIRQQTLFITVGRHRLLTRAPTRPDSRPGYTHHPGAPQPQTAAPDSQRTRPGPPQPQTAAPDSQRTAQDRHSPRLPADTSTHQTRQQTWLYPPPGTATAPDRSHRLPADSAGSPGRRPNHPACTSAGECLLSGPECPGVLTDGSAGECLLVRDY